jgi:hypothetical protein
MAPASHSTSPGLHLPDMPKEAAVLKSRKSIAIQKDIFFHSRLFVDCLPFFSCDSDLFLWVTFRRLLIFHVFRFSCIFLISWNQFSVQPIDRELSNNVNVTIDAKLKHADIVQPTSVTTTISYSRLDPGISSSGCIEFVTSAARRSRVDASTARALADVIIHLRFYF